MTQAPILQTERLILRPHMRSDIDALVAFFGTDRARFMDGPLAPEQAWLVLTSDMALWPLMGAGPWGLERRSDGKFLGQVSIAQPPRFPELELGWCLLAEAEGHGYAHEAAQAARDWSRAQGHQSLVSYIDPENERSIALAGRLGAALDPDAPRPQNDPCLVYRHPMQGGAA